MRCHKVCLHMILYITVHASHSVFQSALFKTLTFSYSKRCVCIDIYQYIIIIKFVEENTNKLHLCIFILCQYFFYVQPNMSFIVMTCLGAISSTLKSVHANVHLIFFYYYYNTVNKSTRKDQCVKCCFTTIT